MRQTAVLRRLASTHAGMRRMLKQSMPVTEYIKKAVQSGCYKSPDDSSEDVKGRHRRQEYPIEYEILTLNPPLPFMPRVPKAYLRREAAKQEPSKRSRFIQSYLHRAENEKKASAKKKELTLDQYYHRLLGIPAPPRPSIMGHKSTEINKAYAFAVKQEQLLRQSPEMTQEESLLKVEALLEEDATKERKMSREMAQCVQAWRAKNNKSKSSTTSSTTTATTTKKKKKPPLLESSSAPIDDETSSVPSLLHSKPRSIQGMQLWSQKLQAVPYDEWTIGASTALNHFVARSILEISEDNWQRLLQGEVGLKSLGRDIVATRQALFPETMSKNDDDDSAESMYGDDDDDVSMEDSKKEDPNKSIDDLLKTLGNFADDDDADDDTTDLVWSTASATSSNDNDDAALTTLVNELQEWRLKDGTYEHDWSSSEKRDFDVWIRKYVETLSTTTTSSEIDYTETRHALLKPPALYQADSNTFWDALKDEASAEQFLENMQDSAEMPIVIPNFDALDRSTQIARLVQLGTLRPLLDEYVSEETRLAFLQRHAFKLLASGDDVEHLVLDNQNGSVSGKDLLKWGCGSGTYISETDRYRIEKRPYDGGGDEKQKELLLAWNRMKVGRAEYEEFRFKQGKLGLRYSDDMTVDEDDDDDDN